MKVLYVKTNSHRSKYYQVSTIIYEENGKRYIKKEAIKPEAIAHLMQMKSNYEQLKKTIISPDIKLANIIDESKSSLTFEFIDGVSLEQLFNNAVKEGPKSIDAFIHNFQDTLVKGFKTEIFKNEYKRQFIDLFGNVDTSKLENKLCLKEVSNIDLIFSNLIYKDNILYIIDYEWVFKCSIPIDYILFRAMTYQVNKCKYNISTELIDLFNSMEKNFQSFIVGDKYSFATVENQFQKNRQSIRPILKLEKVIFKIQLFYGYLLNLKNKFL